MTNFDPSCIDVQDYLDCLEMQNVQRATENEFKFSCPMSSHQGGDQNPSFYMNIRTTACFCQSCHYRGNAIALAASVLGVSPLQATRMLKERYSPAGIDPDSRCMEEEIRKIIANRNQDPIKRENKILEEKCLASFEVNWQALEELRSNGHRNYVPPWAHYMFDRGFSAAALNSWKFGYHQEKDRITLPIRDESGNLVGVKARAPDTTTKPKYLNLRDDVYGIEPFLKNEIVFALDRAFWPGVAGLSSRSLIVVEGEYNAIAMHNFHSLRNCVAINGSYFGNRQIQLIKRSTDRVFLFFDSDRAGWDATISVGEALNPFLEVFVCPDHHGDPMVMHPYSVRRCIEEAIPYRELQMGGIIGYTVP